MADLYKGLTIKNNAGIYLVLKDSGTGGLRLVNLAEGIIYEYDSVFIEQYREQVSESSIEFNLCDVIKRIVYG